MALFDDIGEAMLRRHEGSREIALSLANGVRALRQRFRHIAGRLRISAAPVHRAAVPRPGDATPPGRAPASEPRGESARRDRLAGPSFVAQEPDLAKEAGPNGRQMSGWAMADPGQPE